MKVAISKIYYQLEKTKFSIWALVIYNSNFKKSEHLGKNDLNITMYRP